MNDKNNSKMYFFLQNVQNKKFIDSTIKKIPFDKEIGYAGYKDKKFLRYYLKWSVYNNKIKDEFAKYDEKIIKKIIEECLDIANDKIKVRNLRIFVFPTFNKFTVKKLGGVAGYTSWQNTILIHIYPCKGWQHVLKGVFLHELAHTQTKNFYKENKTIYEQLVHEGMAEVFREKISKNTDNRVLKNVDNAKINKIMKEIKDHLFKIDFQLYKDLFYNADKYPLWTGYALGYIIVKKFLKHKPITMQKLLMIPPKDIIKYYYM